MSGGCETAGHSDTLLVGWLCNGTSTLGKSQAVLCKAESTAVLFLDVYPRKMKTCP